MEPHKKRGAHLEARSSNSTPRFLSTSACQSSMWLGWQRESARLFSEFWRTADAKHLCAFSTHVYAMRKRSGQ